MSQVADGCVLQVNSDNSKGDEVSPHLPWLSVHVDYDSSKGGEVNPHALAVCSVLDLLFSMQVAAGCDLYVEYDNSKGNEVSPHPPWLSIHVDYGSSKGEGVSPHALVVSGCSCKPSSRVR